MLLRPYLMDLDAVVVVRVVDVDVVLVLMLDDRRHDGCTGESESAGGQREGERDRDE
jgi:hypothetical protein